MADDLTTLPNPLTPAQVAAMTGGTGGATTGGGTNWAQIIAMLAGGVGNLATANSTVNNGATAAAMADPWAQFRGQFQTQLADWMKNPANQAGGVPINSNQAGVQNALAMQGNLLANPQSLTSMPGYQFGLNQALEAVNRGAGASGLANSGNRLTALQDRGNSYAQGWENQIYNQLAQNTSSNIGAGQLDLGASQLGLQAQGQGFNQLAGLAGVNAGSPVAAAQAYLQGQQGRTNSIGAGIGGVAGGAAGILSSPQFAQIVKYLTGGSGSASVLPDGTINYGGGVTGAGDQGGFPGEVPGYVDPSLTNTFTDTTGGLPSDDYDWLTSIFGGP